MKHIGVNLHGHGIFHADAAGGKELLHRNTMGAVILHNHAGAEGSGFNERAIQLLGPGLRRQPKDEPAEIGIGQNAAISVPPIQRQQTALPGAKPFGKAGKITLKRQAGGLGLRNAGSRNAIFAEPAEHIAGTALSGLVPPQAWHHAAPDGPADTGHGLRLTAEGDEAGGGAQNGQQLAGTGHSRRRDADMGIYMGDSHRNTGAQMELLRHIRREKARAGPYRKNRGGELLRYGIGKDWVQPAEIVICRIAPRPGIVEGLKACATAAAGLTACQAADDPVSGLHPLIHGGNVSQ